MATEVSLKKTKHFTTHPMVCALGHEYQILVPVEKDSVMWVTCGGQTFYDEDNGVMRSHVQVHRMTLPMDLLDKEKEYTVTWRIMIDRRPYFPLMEEAESLTYTFKPVPDEGPIHIYHVADVHNADEPAIAAGSYFGQNLDLLILNGDVPNESSCFERFRTIYALCSALAKGQLPVVFSRGNHDLRGMIAERMTDYIPHRDGKTYYTFRLGRIWGIVLDCGEDKWDDHPEYGGTVCFHQFRLKQTQYIKDILAHGDTEFNASGVEYRLIISHVPISRQNEEPFNIEEDTYKEWCRLLKDVSPDLMLAGHVHALYVAYPGCEEDAHGAPCPYIVGSLPWKSEGSNICDSYAGTALSLDGRTAHVVFNDHKKNILSQEDILL